MANPKESLTAREIYGQPEGWAGALATVATMQPELREALAGGQVTFTGCGTSYYLSLAAARTYQDATGQTARAVAGSDLYLHTEAYLNRPRHQGTLVAISRSGETSETVEAARFYKEMGHGTVVALTARTDSSLAKTADLTVPLPWADDQSVVMTRSFTTLLLASWAMAATVAKDQAWQAELPRLPELAAPAIEAAEPLAAQLGQDLSLKQFIFLGAGAYYGLAQEGMLKLKEMTRVPSEAYVPLEFRHGPIAVVNDSTAVALLADKRGAAYYGPLLSHIGGYGGKSVAIGSPVAGLPADWFLPLGEDLTDRTRGLLYMPFFQLLGLNRALALGLNPDKPQNLSRVVQL